MLNAISLTLAFLAAGTPAAAPSSAAIEGRWKIDVEMVMQELHASPEYGKADAQTRAALDSTFSTTMPLLTIEITSDTLTGADGTQQFVVKSASAKEVVIHVDHPSPGQDIRFEIIDSNTLRMKDKSDDEMFLLLHRDMAYAARQALPRATKEQRAQWLESMRGVWRVDLAGALLEGMQKSARWAQATAEERAKEVALLRSVTKDAPPDLVEFTESEKSGVAGSTRAPMTYVIATVQGTSAFANVVEANDVKDEWQFERVSADLIRVSSHGELMFLLKREKK
jgi:hypothetical protein